MGRLVSHSDLPAASNGRPAYPDPTTLGLRSAGQHLLADRLHAELLVLGAFAIGPVWTHRDLCAPHWRLYLNLRDGARLRLPDGDLALRAGHAWVVPPWLHFGSASRPGVPHIFVHFTTPALPDAVVRRLVPRPVCVGDASAVCAPLVAAGDATATDAPLTAARLLAVKGAVHAALASVAAQLPPADAAELLAHSQRATPLQALAAEVEADPGAPWTVGDLARRLDCTPDHVGRLFRRHLGTPAGRFVTERRLVAAARALSAGAAIDEVATSHGFATRFSFSRSFAKRFGVGPAAYRRRGG